MAIYKTIFTRIFSVLQAVSESVKYLNWHLDNRWTPNAQVAEHPWWPGGYDAQPAGRFSYERPALVGRVEQQGRPLLSGIIALGDVARDDPHLQLDNSSAANASDLTQAASLATANSTADQGGDDDEPETDYRRVAFTVWRHRMSIAAPHSRFVISSCKVMQCNDVSVCKVVAGEAKCIPTQGSKAGFCPTASSRVKAGDDVNCSRPCAGDQDCDEDLKCCQSSCGKSCRRPSMSDQCSWLTQYNNWRRTVQPLLVETVSTRIQVRQRDQNVRRRGLVSAV